MEQLTGGASAHETLPLIVTLHGRGSDPKRFQSFFQDLPAKMRIVHLQAPVKEQDGRAWFQFRGKTRDMIGEEIDLLADLAVQTTSKVMSARPTEGKPAVVGFSQGAMVVYAIAMRHPQTFRKAIPVSGVLIDMPENPPVGDAMPPVVALHGERDPVIGPRASTDAVRQLTKMGVDARVELIPGAVHWIDGDLKKALYRELTQ